MKDRQTYIQSAERLMLIKQVVKLTVPIYFEQFHQAMTRLFLVLWIDNYHVARARVYIINYTVVQYLKIIYKYLREDINSLVPYEHIIF